MHIPTATPQPPAPAYAHRPAEDPDGQAIPQAHVTVGDLHAFLAPLNPALRVFLGDGRHFAAPLSTLALTCDTEEIRKEPGEFIIDPYAEPATALILLPTARLGDDYPPPREIPGDEDRYTPTPDILRLLASH